MECPVCKTSEFVEYEYGTHAEVFDGSYDSYENYTCKKCSGYFSVHKVGKNDDVETLEIEWKKHTPIYMKSHNSLITNKTNF